MPRTSPSFAGFSTRCLIATFRRTTKIIMGHG
jgi:hypothetical protein